MTLSTRRRLVRLVTTAGGLLALAACTAAPGPTTALGNAGVAPLKSGQPSADRPPPDDNPARLKGMMAGELTALLGEPVRVRRDGTAEIRQFGTESTCRIDTFLYPDADMRRVTHIEIRHGLDRLDATAARACLRSLMAARASS
jgi:hypothetical protein